MARGKKADIESYVTNIAPYLEVGCSLHEACSHGLVPYTTVKDYYDKDEEVRKNIDRLKNKIILEARSVIYKQIQDGDKDIAKWYLERKKKNEFSLKYEQSTVNEINIVYADNQDKNL